MSGKVNAFLLRHNFLKDVDDESIISAVREDMERAFRGEKANQDMIKTFLLPPEKKVKNEKVIIIDAGGTNFRSALVSFDEEGKAIISEMRKTKMPGSEKELDKKEFFSVLAENILYLKGKAERIGFCFSYPMQILEGGEGKLLDFSKEIKAPAVIGSLIASELKAALEEKGMREVEKITMLNDTVAALLAGHAAVGEEIDFSSYIGFILGTGLNTAYIQKERDNMKKQIIVCESGKIHDIPASDFDKELDSSSERPSLFRLEKQCAGGYLGHLSRLVLKGAAEEGLFESPSLTKKLSTLPSLSLIDVDSFLHFPSKKTGVLGELLAEESENERDTAYALLDAVVERAAKTAAAALSATVIQSEEGKNPARPVCILCNGTTFYKTHLLKERFTSEMLKNLSEKRGIYFRIISAENDITIGTAIAAFA